MYAFVFLGMSTSAGQNFVLSAPTTYEIRSYRKQSSNSIRRLQELPGVSSLQMTAKYPIATTEYEIKIVISAIDGSLVAARSE